MGRTQVEGKIKQYHTIRIRSMLFLIAIQVPSQHRNSILEAAIMNSANTEASV